MGGAVLGFRVLVREASPSSRFTSASKALYAASALDMVHGSPVLGRRDLLEGTLIILNPYINPNICLI